MIFTAPKLAEEELEVIGQIEQMRGKLQYTISAPNRWFGVLRKATLARNIRHSNSIEGINVSRDDAMAAVENEEPLSADKADWLATVGYRNAMTYVLQLASDPHFSYSADLLRGLHFMMVQHELSKNPGRWRPGIIFVYDELKQQNVYEGPEADRIPELITGLIESLNQVTDVPVTVRAALGHLNLVMIHPFSDGNGRMARCLQTLILAREQIIEAPFCSIEEYLGRFTQPYYDILGEVGQGSWHPENDTRQWIRFNLIAHYRQAHWLLQRSRITERVWNELERITENKRLPPRCLLALADAAFGYKVRNSTYRSGADISDQVASRDLKTLVNEGLLVAGGETRGRIYTASEVLNSIYIRNYERRTNIDPFEALKNKPTSAQMSLLPIEPTPPSGQ